MPTDLELRATRAKLATATGKQKLDLIMSSPNPRALVQALPAQELYLALLDIGIDDSAELVAMATGTQFRHFVDAHAWPKRGAPPDPRRVMHWLTLAREGGGSSDQAMRRFHDKLASLDAELFALLLRRQLVVHDLTENDNPMLRDDGATWHTPDRKYLVEFNAEGSGYAVLRRLLDDLAQQDAFLISRMLEALRWELPSELEEMASRWREGRLRDEGVPELEEALAFVARPARSAKRTGAGDVPSDASGKAAQDGAANGTAALATRGAPPVPMLQRAIARLEGNDLIDAEESIGYAINAALVAWSVALDDQDDLRPALTSARALLSLGLELRSHGDEELAAQLLATTPIRDTFQAAMGELYRLQTRARLAAAAARLPQAQAATMLDAPHASLLEALAGTPPLALDAQGARAAPSSRAEVAAVELLLDEAEALPSLLAQTQVTREALGALAEAAGISASALRASDVFLALAHCDLRGRALSLAEVPERGAPLPAGLLERLDSRLAAGVESNPAGPKRAAAERLAARLRQRILER